jgi:outer membrane protein
MKLTGIICLLKLSLVPLFFWTSVSGQNAQSTDSRTIKLSLNEAIQYAKESNKLIGALKTEESATRSDVEDAKMGALPRVLSNAVYQRYSEVTLYNGVWGNSYKVPKPPDADAGALGFEASLNLYSGGRQRSVIADMKRKRELASIDTKEQEGTIALQVTLQYLDMIRLYFQWKLIKDQVTRASLRSKNIDAFYANGKITKTDVLRADVLLSSVLLSEDANRNDNLISNQKLNTLLNLDEFTRIIPTDTTSLIWPDSVELEGLLVDFSGNYAILKAQKNIELQENRIKLTKSFNLPIVNLFGGYGFNYPNTLIFPPVAQTFAVGQVGVRFIFDISSLYQNKYKVKSALLRETKLNQQKEWIEDNVQQEAKALTIKFNEAVNRVHVIRKSIDHAEVNYKIQNTKYANQLILLTDLLEADNLYQESRVNYLHAKIAALVIYYRLLFINGKL